jgi:hypothetical protein
MRMFASNYLAVPIWQYLTAGRMPIFTRHAFTVSYQNCEQVNLLDAKKGLGEGV